MAFVGVDLDRASDQFTSLVIGPLREFVGQNLCPQNQIVGPDGRKICPRGSLRSGRFHPAAHGRGDGSSYFFLDNKYVLHHSVISFGPHVIAGGGIYELRCDAKPIYRGANAALDDEVDS